MAIEKKEAVAKKKKVSNDMKSLKKESSAREEFDDQQFEYLEEEN